MPTYLALSHCWGQVDIDAAWRLNSGNKTQYYRELPESVLRRTFIDAVKITRDIGESYLWVDSLCILQDCSKDWDIESKKMAGIYANALCTISSASDSAHGGCVLPRRTNLRLELASGHVRFYSRIDCAEEIRCPVYQRAWCLQERELAKRFVQYTDRGFLWYCAERQVTELEFIGSVSQCNSALPILGRQTRENGLQYRYDHGDERNLPYGSVSKDDFSPYAYWYGLVTRYMERKITRPTDRLPAIAGLATRIGKIRPTDHYAGGLWMADMSNGLLWQPRNSSREPPAEPIAPSWSWACLNAPISFKWDKFNKVGTYGLLKAPLFSVLPAEGSSPFPLLRITGYAIRAQPTKDNMHDREDLHVCDERIKYNEPDNVYDGYVLQRDGPFAKDKKRHQLTDNPTLMAKWDRSTEPSCLSETFYCLIFGTEAWGRDEEADYKELCGLILRSVDKEVQRYKRVGTFEAHSREPWSE